MSRLLGHPALAPAWTVLIIALCTIPGSELPEVDVIAADKLVHAFIFAVFAVLWCRRQPRVRPLTILIGGVILAVLTEPYQGWIGLGRIPDPYDTLANTIGLLAGLVGSCGFGLRFVSSEIRRQN